MIWNFVTKPGATILKLVVYECKNCHMRVIAFDEYDNNHQPSIRNYKYCPYCGYSENSMNK